MLRRLIVCLMVGIILSAGLLADTPAANADSRVAAYPIIPSIGGAVSLHLRQLIRAGKQAGNRINVFSKIGDSITATPYFLYPVGSGGLRLGGYTNLQSTVDFFMQTPARTNNSFANDSLAAHGQWSTREVLNPAASFNGVCGSGETPLDCELRITKPAVALIMFGANDVRAVPLNEFRANLDRIVTIVERHGVIPVLSTTPERLDNPPANIEPYNLAIISIAQAHRIPLWNFWLGLRGLKESGLASNDHIHPSIPNDGNTAIFDVYHLGYGAVVRNLEALQVLDVLRRTVLR